MSEHEDSAAASASASAPEQQLRQDDDDDDLGLELGGDKFLERLQRYIAEHGPDLICIPITKYDFRDDELMNEPGIRLERCTDDEIAKLGRKVMPMASSRFSEQGAAAVLVLAYHLRSPGTDYKEYVFTDGDRYTTTSDQKYDDFPDGVQGPAEADPISMTSPITDSAKEAAVYSYIAASMLRLFAMPAASYVKAWNRIIEEFPKFYGKSVNMFTMRALLPASPNEESMEGLSDWFSHGSGARVTLYRLLHMSNANQEHARMKSFLYDKYLSYTGLHVVHMLFEICKVLSCSPSEVVAAVKDITRTEQIITSLTHILELDADDGEEHKRRMWRYGRLFSTTFMDSLQTKACRTLVYTFAEALKSEKPEAYSGMLRIYELAYLTDSDQERCAAAAQQLLTTIKASKT